MRILGIETSCDDTAVAIVEDGAVVLNHALISQIDVHKEYNGVVPELAARKHLEALLPLIDCVIEGANVTLSSVDAIAVTNRPGLVGSLLVGVSAAKGLAYALNKPLIAVDHIAAHSYAAHLTHEIAFPYIALIVSGGHTLLMRVTDHGEYAPLGTTLDDAVGEAYDKLSKYMGLGYPGGPVIDLLAQKGNPNAIRYPKAKIDRYNFSYSGLKTAAIYQTERLLNEGHEATRENIAASFQKAAIDTLYEKTILCAKEEGVPRVVLGGGVAANSYLRKRFTETEDVTAYLPDRQYTSDNAAMAAGLAYHRAKKGDYADMRLDVASRVVERTALRS